MAGVAYGQGMTEIERAAARRAGAVPAASAKPSPSPEQANGTGDGGRPPPAGAPRAKGFNFYDSRLMGGAWQQEARPAMLRDFFRILAVCHTVTPDGTLPAVLALSSRIVGTDRDF